MTQKEALKAAVGYPLRDEQLEFALLKQGVVSGDLFSNSKAFNLAIAEALLIVLNTPNISEGGYSISLSDKQAIQNRISSIYATYSLQSPNAPQIRDRSNIW